MGGGGGSREREGPWGIIQESGFTGKNKWYFAQGAAHEGGGWRTRGEEGSSPGGKTRRTEESLASMFRKVVGRLSDR